MTNEEVKSVATEINDQLSGLRFGRVYPLSATSAAIDFVPHRGVYLFLDLSRRYRSAYLIVRKRKFLERNSIHSPSFVMELRKALSGAILERAEYTLGGLCLGFSDETGDRSELTIRLFSQIPALAFRRNKSDLEFLLGKASAIDGGYAHRDVPTVPVDHGGVTVSEALDRSRLEIEEEEKFDSMVRSARKYIRDQIQRRSSLLVKLKGDLEKHGDPEKWKYYGELILSNMATLHTADGGFLVIDYFDEYQPTITIPAKEGLSAKQTAEYYFNRYARARNANNEIAAREQLILAEVAELESKGIEIESAILDRDITRILEAVDLRKPETAKPRRKKREKRIREAREFISSDGVNILVGKSAIDNDTLTFRLGRSNDIWLHAADYPGSHVLVKNSDRKKLSPSTLVEAAQLAAFYSEARNLPKVAVNYTSRKFVHKPKKAAPGLVRLSSFKTILVVPEFPLLVQRKVV